MLYWEKEQEIPKYEEMCRRFLADAKDFSEEKLKEAKEKLLKFSNTEPSTADISKEINTLVFDEPTNHIDINTILYRVI